MLIPLGILAAQAPAVGDAYELISTQVLTANAASVTFSSIPQEYRHLQLRWVARSSHSSVDRFNLRLNGNTGSNYAWHGLFGNGSAVSSSTGFFPTDLIQVFRQVSNRASVYSTGVIDITDYSSTSKNTITLGLSDSTDRDGGTSTQGVELASGLFLSTAAVTSLQAFTGLGNFVTGSRFSLYGIRG